MIIPGGKANLADNSFGNRLERQRIHLLYRQNYAGVLASLLYAVPWIYVSWPHDSHEFLLGWFGLLVGVYGIRCLVTYAWMRRKPFLNDAAELRYWLHALQGMLFCSGLVWGCVTWRYGLMTSEAQKMFLVIILVFMCAGSIVSFSASFMSTVMLMLPSCLPWVISLFYFEPTKVNYVIAAVALIYLALALAIAYRLHRYVKQSLRLAVENELAREALAESDNRLRVSLESSRATAWSWDPATQTLICESAVFREPLREALALAPATGMEIDLDHKYFVRDQSFWMAVRGQAQQEGEGYLRRWKGVCWDITERKMREELSKDRDVLEAANKSKSVFLANVSHEIRTPLTAIVGSTQILLNSVTNETTRKDLQMTLKNATYLTALVNDLLDLSKVESGRLYIQKSMAAIRDEVREAIQPLSELIATKGVDLKLEYLSEIPEYLETDPTRFRQVLINLVSNAVKFSAGGTVHLRIVYHPGERAEGLLRINISDNGLGMDEQAQSQLFQAFARGGSALMHKVPGSGLGLALSRNLARLMGGDLRLVWSAPARGSEFEWTLETRSGGPATTASMRSLQPIAPIESQRSRPLEGVRILLAEDSLDILELMIRFLEIKGATIEGVENGQLALEKAMTGAFDIVLMDINMPVMDGYRATSELRRRGFGRPIIALTAHASMDDRQLCLTAGCNAYISKPVDIEHLVRTIREQLRATVPFQPNRDIPTLH